MKNLIIIVTLLFLLTANTNVILGKGDIDKKTSEKSVNTTKKIISYSAEPRSQLRVFFDYYHHSLPAVKIGKYITTGSWIDDKGRYGWDDFVHTNSLDHLYIVLENDYQIFMHQEAYTKNMLKNADMVVIMSVDDPAIVSGMPYISDEEITALRNYVLQGGSLMVMVNAGTPSRANEGFEKKQLGKLVNSFGLKWNNDDTHYSDLDIPAGHPCFYDVSDFHYGAGCTLSILPNASKPEVLLDVYSDQSYTDRKVSGPGIVMVRPGKGKFILVGDVGTWTGNLSRPWADNVRILKQLFLHLQPDQGVKYPSLKEGKELNYEVAVTGLQAVPVANSLSEIKNNHYQMFSPRPITNLPFFERSGNIVMKCKEVMNNGDSKIEVTMPYLKWFDEKSNVQNEQSIKFNVSRQGKVRDVEAYGDDAHWLSPDISLLVALIPSDGIRPGDKWNTIEPIRVPILKGSDFAPVKKYDMNVVYVRDTEINGRTCRLLRSSNEIWLDELGVKIEDLLPQEFVRQVEGGYYQFLNKKGGKLLFKREQWVDKETGDVLQAKGQTRVIAWIHDNRKPVPEKNLDKDNEMIVSIAHVVNFKLKEW
ncbi:MAG TPA: hypothetical protein DEH15_19910 [Marinilabiliales bacterium]|nr:hypothetical protein [Marinilabiliales bacterium]